MKREKLRSHRVKQCVNLVELIRNRQRSQPFSLSGSSRYRRNIRRDNILMGNSCCLGANSSGSLNQHFPSNDLAATKVFGKDPTSNASAMCNSENKNALNIFKDKKQTQCKPEPQVSVSSCEFMNNFAQVSNITENETKISEEKGYTNPNYITENHLEVKKNICDISDKEQLVHSNENDIISEGIDNTQPKTSQLSSVTLNIPSNQSEEIPSVNENLNAISSRSIYQNLVNSFLVEHASSSQILADEEAGGDGHHNNSVIEIEITLQSSNETNSEDDEQAQELNE